MTPTNRPRVTGTAVAGTAAAVSMALAALASAPVAASSHGEAPFIKERPKVDGTDLYAFNSYEPGRDGYVTLIANYQPLQDPYGGPNYFSMDEDAIYEIHVDNDGDAVEDLSFVFDFDNSLNGGTGLSLQIGDELVAVPQKNIGPLTPGGDNQSVLNVNETYYVGVTTGDRRSGTPMWAVRPDSGLNLFTKPLDYVGNKSFPEGYAPFVGSLTNSGQAYYDVRFDACPEGAQDGRVFAGQRKESFSIALAEIFDLVNFVPLADALPDDPARNDLADKNITSLAVEVPAACLTGNGNGVIGVWTTSSQRSMQTIADDASYEEPVEYRGEFRQVSRLGMPLVNEVVIGLPDKNRFNASEPTEDGQFATYVTNPTLPAILDLLFRDALGAPDDIAPALPRTDLVTTFLTGFEGVNQLATVTPSEMLRLNTGIPATPKDSQVNLGVAGGDLAGFPNGRRPGDDVTDISLRVVMGALCHPIAVDLDGSGTAGDAGDNLGLCTPEDAPAGTLALTDGAPQNASQFDAVFPYLTTPLTGSPVEALEPDSVDDGMDDGMDDVDDGMQGDMQGGMDGADMDDGDMMAGMDCPVDAGSVSGQALSSTELELSWDAGDGVSSYEVFVDGSFLQETDVPNVTVGGLDPATGYLVEVVPVGPDGTRFDCLPGTTVTTNG